MGFPLKVMIPVLSCISPPLATCALTRRGAASGRPVTVSKTIRALAGAPTLEIRYRLQGVEAAELAGSARFAVELNFALVESMGRVVVEDGKAATWVPFGSLLAEAAFLECALLVTSDAHLRGVDHELLTLVLNPFDLTPPVIATPREIVRKFFR